MKNIKSFEQFINESADSKMIQKAIKISGELSLDDIDSAYASDLPKVLNAKNNEIFAIITSDGDAAEDLNKSQIKVLDDLQNELLTKGKKISISGAKEAYLLGNVIMVNSGISGEPYEIYATK